MNRKEKRDGIYKCLVMVLGGIFHMFLSGYLGYYEYNLKKFTIEMNFEFVKLMFVSLFFGSWFIFSIGYTFIHLKIIILILFNKR